MKKLISLLLVFCLAAFTCAALAEDVTLTEDNAKVEIAGVGVADLEPSEVESYALGGYSVTNNNETYTINTGSLTFQVSLGAYPEVYTLTRDYAASFAAFMYFDYDAVLSFFEENDIHLLLYDAGTDNQTILYTIPGDETASYIGNFTALSAANKAVMAKANSGTETIYTIGNCDWFRISADTLVTIVNGQYVVLCYGTSDGATDADFADSCNYLSTLTIK